MVNGGGLRNGVEQTPSTPFRLARLTRL